MTTVQWIKVTPRGAVGVDGLGGGKGGWGGKKKKVGGRGTEPWNLKKKPNMQGAPNKMGGGD